MVFKHTIRGTLRYVLTVAALVLILVGYKGSLDRDPDIIKDEYLRLRDAL
jgi:hypothetical protein